MTEGATSQDLKELTQAIHNLALVVNGIQKDTDINTKSISMLNRACIALAVAIAGLGGFSVQNPEVFKGVLAMIGVGP